MLGTCTLLDITNERGAQPNEKSVRTINNDPSRGFMCMLMPFIFPFFRVFYFSPSSSNLFIWVNLTFRFTSDGALAPTSRGTGCWASVEELVTMPLRQNDAGCRPLDDCEIIGVLLEWFPIIPQTHWRGRVASRRSYAAAARAIPRLSTLGDRFCRPSRRRNSA